MMRACKEEGCTGVCMLTGWGGKKVVVCFFR